MDFIMSYCPEEEHDIFELLFVFPISIHEVLIPSCVCVCLR